MSWRTTLWFATCPASWISYLLGLLTGLGWLALWRAVQLWLDTRATRMIAAALAPPLSHDPWEQCAYDCVTACKKRLRWQRNPTPAWITPLIDEISRLVRDIAIIYYPTAADPLRAPGLSHFTCVIHYAAMA